MKKIFNSNEINDSPLSNEERMEGNKILLDFLGKKKIDSNEWVVECALCDRSWNILMEVAEKIKNSRVEVSPLIDRKIFDFEHQMFHEIIGKRNYFYRQCVVFAKFYNDYMRTLQLTSLII